MVNSEKFERRFQGEIVTVMVMSHDGEEHEYEYQDEESTVEHDDDDDDDDDDDRFFTCNVPFSSAFVFIR